MNKKGLFIFCGIDEYDEMIFDVIEPLIVCNMFYYNCGNKFITEICEKYFQIYSGYIVFISGEQCLIYNYSGEKFILDSSFESMIPNKHKKGGQSSVRFGRIADNIRQKYIITIIEHLNPIAINQCWLFGSIDVIDVVMLSIKNKNIKKGFFVDFDKSTINNTNYWLSFLEQNDTNDDKMEIIIDCMSKNPELITFDSDYDLCEIIIVNPLHVNFINLNLDQKKNDKIYKLSPKSRFFAQLKDFDIICKLYFKNY